MPEPSICESRRKPKRGAAVFTYTRPSRRPVATSSSFDEGEPPGRSPLAMEV
jgi:hypothetical protein